MKSPPITIIHARHAIVGRALFGGAYLQRRARARPCNGAKEIEAFHRARRANFRQPEMFHAAHIVKHVNEEQTGEQADGGVEDDGCGEFAAGEDVVADGELVVAEELGDALVDAFVAAADEDYAIERGEASGRCLRKPSPLLA